MMIHTKRTITQGAYLKELEATHTSIKAFERVVRHDPSKRPLLEEWKFFASHPERNLEVLTLERTVMFHDFEEFVKIVTPQRLRILEYLRSHPDVDSLNELARGVGRDYRNVHDDVKRLEATGAVRLETKRNRVVPRAATDSIEITI